MKTDLWKTRLFLALLLLLSRIAIAAPGDNVALASAGGIATQSSFFNNNWPANNCINGVTVSNSNSQLCHTKRRADTNEWWDVELPTSVPIDEIVIYNRTNCCTNRILGLYVLVSDTPFPPGSDFASLAVARSQATFEFLISVDAPVTTIPVGNVSGNYIRIQKSGVGINVLSAINLLEVQVFEGGQEEIDLSVTKSVSETAPNIGDTLTFTLTLSNQGPVTATDFTVNDELPSGFGSVSAISNGGTQGASGDIEWTIPSLASGASINLTFDAVVLPP